MREEIVKDHAVARIAARQYGVVTTVQLQSAGLDRNAVSRRVQSGRLHRLYRGVYAVGHVHLERHGRWLAAALACGPDAVLSHRSAAALWDLRPVPSGPIEVTVPARGQRASRDGLRVHRSIRLNTSNVTTKDGIPVTTPARTVADLRRVLPPDQLKAMIRRAEVLRLDIGPQAGYTPDPTRSELERRFLRLCKRQRLPDPQVNVLVGPFMVDFLWPDHHLIVETDGFEHHGTRTAFESDRERDARLKLLGYTVVRFTHRQLSSDPAGVAQTLNVLLAVL